MMRYERSRTWRLVVTIVAAWALGLGAGPSWAAEADSRDDANPWGLAPGAGTRFNPQWSRGGIGWVRMFDEWGGIQPAPDQWHWERVDKLVADAKAHNVHVTAIWLYFAKFASADGGTRRGPIKDMQYFRDYVTASVTRYQKDIKYWEVWNELNGSFYEGKDKVREYADLVVAAYDSAKKVDPTAQVGMSVASSDIGFFDLVIKAGAANHFDYLCVHPYENMDAVMHGDEPGFLSLAGTLRQMLADNHQRPDIGLWITEMGSAPAGEALVKGYVMALAQGFQRICWFSRVGREFTLMVRLLGHEPHYLGWLKTGEDGYGFVFQGQEKGRDVLVAWAPVGTERQIKFDAGVRVQDLAGQESDLAAGTDLNLTQRPVFVVGLPEPLVHQALEQAHKPFPWGGDYAQASQVKCILGQVNVDQGLHQIVLRKEHENLSVPATVDGAPCRRVVGTDHDHACAYFRADPGYVPFGPRALDITVVARRAAADQPAELALTYETRAGYRDFKSGFEPWTIPAGDGWQEHTWHVTDACFANRWGWHFGLVVPGAFKEFLIKEVRLAKSEPSANP